MIGNQNYNPLDKLKTPVADAEAVAKILKEKYGFEVTLLKNANSAQMRSALSHLRATMTKAMPQESLLIYYAGHGSFDPATNRHYWLPVDADKDRNDNWIRTDEVTDLFVALNHIGHHLVVADSCYAEWTLTRDPQTKLPDRGWAARMWQRRSRHALTSGANEPVVDSGKGEHSIFAWAFLEALEKNYEHQEILDGNTLFDQVKYPIAEYVDNCSNCPKQTPVYNYIPNAEDEHGDFLFLPVNIAGSASISKALLANFKIKMQYLGLPSSNISPALLKGGLPPNPSSHIKNIKIVYDSSTEKDAHVIGEALQRNNFPATLEEFDKWDSSVLKNGMTHKQLSYEKNTIFFPVSLQESVNDVKLIVNPLLKGGPLANKPLDDERIIMGASIDTDEALIVLDDYDSESRFVWPFSFFVN